MAKAHIELPDGSKITIDGTEAEVARLLAPFSGSRETTSEPKPAGRRAKQPRLREGAKSRNAVSKTTKGPADYIRELAADGFFKSKKDLGEVRDRLEQDAHIYPVTSLSPTLYRLVGNKELRRIKEDGQWKYVNR